MRLVLSTACIVVATALACHGLFLDGQADRSLAPEEISRRWPYSEAAVDARRAAALARASAVVPVSVDPVEDPGALAWGLVERGFRGDAPFVDPHAAAALGLAALLLAAFLPRQRCRSLTIVTFLLGGLAVLPSFLTPRNEADLVREGSEVSFLVGTLPWIAIGLVFAGGLFLASRRGPAAFDPLD